MVSAKIYLTGGIDSGQMVEAFNFEKKRAWTMSSALLPARRPALQFHVRRVGSIGGN